MKPSLAQWIVVTGCALFAAQASAQSTTAPRKAAPAQRAAAPTAKAPAAPATKTVTAAAAVQAAPMAAVSTVNVAGSVIVLADGIVANAAMATIQPPADGFVYER